MRDTCRRIDDQRLNVTRHSQLPAASGLHGILVGIDAVYLREVCWASLEPRYARTLPVEIHQGRGRTTRCITGRDIRRDRRLAATPFGIEDDNLITRFLSRRILHIAQ